MDGQVSCVKTTVRCTNTNNFFYQAQLSTKNCTRQPKAFLSKNNPNNKLCYHILMFFSDFHLIIYFHSQNRYHLCKQQKDSIYSKWWKRNPGPGGRHVLGGASHWPHQPHPAHRALDCNAQLRLCGLYPWPFHWWSEQRHPPDCWGPKWRWYQTVMQQTTGEAVWEQSMQEPGHLQRRLESIHLWLHGHWLLVTHLWER